MVWSAFENCLCATEKLVELSQGNSDEDWSSMRTHVRLAGLKQSLNKRSHLFTGESLPCPD